MSTLGNAWVDLLRITLWVLVPVALLIALFLFNKVRCKLSALSGCEYR